MKFYLGVTNNNWYRYLAARSPEDVNFWQPGGSTAFRALRTGGPFLFKLKKPLDAIGGIGFFSSYTKLPLSVAWETFATANGCDNLETLRQLIARHRSDRENPNPQIGCIVLTNPVFFDEQDWIETPYDWSKNIVQGKTYSDEEAVGKAVWNRVQMLLEEKYLKAAASPREAAWAAPAGSPAYGQILSKVRLGQSAFRILVTDAYTRRCAISGEKTLPVLEAAHIRPFAQQGPHDLSNGILLRSDIHKLFDSGYITVTPSFHIEVSSRIRAEFENGREYYQYHGKALSHLPQAFKDQPSVDFINWHNTNIYNG